MPERRPAPPQPRVRRPIPPRLVLQSLAIGLVLAVMGVPVLAIVAEHVPASWERLPVNDALHVEGHARDQTGDQPTDHAIDHVVLTRRTELVVATVWFTTSEPLAQDATTLRLAWAAGARDATEDLRPPRLRPPRLRTALDGRRRVRSESQVGWPWRAAYGHSAQVLGPQHLTESRGQRVIGLLGRPYLVPYLPLWSGLLGNALVYGAVVLGVRVAWRWWHSRGG